MNRWGIILLTFLGLMLVSVLLPVSLAFASCDTSCTPSACGTNCTWYSCGTVSITGIAQIKTTIYDNSLCSGAGQTVSTLPFTDPDGDRQSTLRTPALTAYACNVPHIVSGPACCIPTTCTAPTCESTAGTDNCGNPCTATAEPCFCSMGASYIVAPTKDSMWPADTLSFGANCPHDCVIDTSYQTASWCSATTGTIEAVTDNESGCGSSGTPSTTCNPIFSLGCQSACSACSVECTPTVCPDLSCSVIIGNCGQTCPITCDDEEHYCNGSRCVYVPPPPECFVAGTKVLLANGKETPIERLKAGDILLGSEGAHNKVVKLKIDPKKDWTIYAFNGGRYFVTKNHVFSTTAGWASINPESALRENPQLKIRKLKIGDVLITLQGSMRIEKITSKTAKDSVVYSPELDGNHEYYADGFLVHNSQIITQP